MRGEGEGPFRPVLFGDRFGNGAHPFYLAGCKDHARAVRSERAAHGLADAAASAGDDGDLSLEGVIRAVMGGAIPCSLSRDERSGCDASVDNGHVHDFVRTHGLEFAFATSSSDGCSATSKAAASGS